MWRSPGRLCTPGKPYRAGRSRQASRFSADPVTLCHPETRNAGGRSPLKSRPGKPRRVVNVNFAAAALIRRWVSFASEHRREKRERAREQKRARENEKGREHPSPGISSRVILELRQISRFAAREIAENRRPRHALEPRPLLERKRKTRSGGSEERGEKRREERLLCSEGWISPEGT